MKKLVFAHDALNSNAKVQRIYRNVAINAGYGESQVVFVSDARKLAAEISSAMDELCVFLSQTFDHSRWDANSILRLRKLPTRNVVRIVLLINRPREDVFVDELREFLNAEIYDIYFLNEVNSPRHMMEIAAKPATPERAYAYLGIDAPRPVSRVGHIPPRDAIAGLDTDKKKSKKVSLKKYVFSPPVEETVVRSDVRRLVAVMSHTGEVGASALALNLALAIAARGGEIAYEEFPPVSKYYIDNFLRNDVIQPIQHAVQLYRNGKAPTEENIAKGISWYYELSRGSALSPEWLKEDFFRQYFAMPREELPIILDVGSAYKRLLSLGVSDCVTDVVVAVRIERLEGTIERMNELLMKIAELGIRPLLVVLDSPPKDLPYFKDYDVFFVNTEKTDAYGVYMGAEEELSPVIEALKLFTPRVLDAPEASSPDAVDQIPYEDNVVVPTIVTQESTTEPSTVMDPMAVSENVSSAFDTERQELLGRIAELERLNGSLSSGIRQANENIQKQNDIILNQSVRKSDYEDLAKMYGQLKEQYEALQASSDAAGRDRESLSTAVSERDTELSQRAEAIANLQGAVSSLQDEVAKRDGTVAELTNQLAQRDQTIASLQSGSSTAATKAQEIASERDALRNRIVELENEAALSKSILSSKDSEIGSLKEQVAEAKDEVTAAEKAAVEKRKELETEYQTRMEELTRAMDSIKEESSGDKQKLIEQLQAAEATKKDIEARKDSILLTARMEAERIRVQAGEEAAKVVEDARASLTKEYETLNAKLQSAEELRLAAERKMSEAEEEGKKIRKQAEDEAERLKDASLSDVANRSAEVEELRRQAEQSIADAAVEAERIIAGAKEHEDVLLEREAGIENREHELKLERIALDKQKEQLIQDQVALGTEQNELARQKKDLERKVKEFSNKEEDAKDRQAKRAEKERRAIAREAERADRHRLKMEERKNGSASGLTFVLCLTVLAIVFGCLLFLVYKKGNDEVKDLRTRLDGIEEASATVLVAAKDLPEGSIVTMSDFIEVSITTEDVSEYVSSFSGTLTLTKPLTKGQCLTTASFEEGGGGE